VVNDLTYHDQSFILSLAKMLPNNGNQKQLFIVHNFKDCYDYDEALVLWRKQVLNPFKIKEKEINFKNCRLKMAQNHKHRCTHFFMINDKVDHPTNELVISHLKTQINSSFFNGSLIERLEQSLSTHLNFYMAFENQVRTPTRVSLNFTRRVIELMLDKNVNESEEDYKNRKRLTLRDYTWDPRAGIVYFNPPTTESNHPFSFSLGEDLIIEFEVPGIEKVSLAVVDEDQIRCTGNMDTYLTRDPIDIEVTHAHRSFSRDYTFHIPKLYETNSKLWKKEKLNGVLTLTIPQKLQSEPEFI